MKQSVVGIGVETGLKVVVHDRLPVIRLERRNGSWRRLSPEEYRQLMAGNVLVVVRGMTTSVRKEGNLWSQITLQGPKNRQVELVVDFQVESQPFEVSKAILEASETGGTVAFKAGPLFPSGHGWSASHLRWVREIVPAVGEIDEGWGSPAARALAGAVQETGGGVLGCVPRGI